MLNLIYNLVN